MDYRIRQDRLPGDLCLIFLIESSGFVRANIQLPVIRKIL